MKYVRASEFKNSDSVLSFTVNLIGLRKKVRNPEREMGNYMEALMSAYHTCLYLTFLWLSAGQKAVSHGRHLPSQQLSSLNSTLVAHSRASHCSIVNNLPSRLARKTGVAKEHYHHSVVLNLPEVCSSFGSN